MSGEKFGKRAGLVALFVVLAIAAGVAGFIFAQKGDDLTAVSMRLYRMVGEVSLYDASGQESALLEEMRLYSGHSLATAEESLVMVSLDETKLLTMEENSKASIEADGRALSFKLTEGDMYFNVTEKLDDDETFDIEVSNMICGIRGTSGYVGKDSTGHELLMVTDGVVHVTAQNPVTGELTEADVNPGEMVTVYMDDEAAGDASVSFSTENFREEDLPALALNAIEKNPALLERVVEACGFSEEKIPALADALSVPGETMVGRALAELDEYGIADSIPYMGDKSKQMTTVAGSAADMAGVDLELEIAIIRGLTDVSAAAEKARYTGDELIDIVNTATICVNDVVSLAADAGVQGEELISVAEQTAESLTASVTDMGGGGLASSEITRVIETIGEVYAAAIEEAAENGGSADILTAVRDASDYVQSTVSTEMSARSTGDETVVALLGTPENGGDDDEAANEPTQTATAANQNARAQTAEAATETAPAETPASEPVVTAAANDTGAVTVYTAPASPPAATQASDTSNTGSTTDMTADTGSSTSTTPAAPQNTSSGGGNTSGSGNASQNTSGSGDSGNSGDTGNTGDSGNSGGTTDPDPSDPTDPNTPNDPQTTKYSVTIAANIVGGTVTADVTEAEKGVTVNLTVKPNDDYEIVSVTATDAAGAAITLTAGTETGKYTFTMPESTVTVAAEFEEKPTDPQTPKYSITAETDIVGGTVKADVTEAGTGTIVTVTATPNDGYAYKADSVKVLDESENAIELTAGTETGVYTFTMPEGAVTVTAEFEEKEKRSIETSIWVSSGDLYTQGGSEVGSIAVTTGLDTGETLSYEGDTVVLDITPVEPYVVDNVYIFYSYTDENNNMQWEEVTPDSDDTDDGGRHITFTMPDYDVEVQADFSIPATPKTYGLQITTLANSNGSYELDTEGVGGTYTIKKNGVEITETETVTTGDTFTIDTTPNYGYRLGYVVCYAGNYNINPKNPSGGGYYDYTISPDGNGVYTVETYGDEENIKIDIGFIKGYRLDSYYDNPFAAQPLGGTISIARADGNANITNIPIGTEIVITATPNDGFALDTVSVKTGSYPNYSDVSVTVSGNTATFTMPEGDVYIESVTFKRTASGPITLTLPQTSDVISQYLNMDGVDEVNLVANDELNASENAAQLWGITIPAGKKLTIGENVTIKNSGTITCDGTLINSGTILNRSTITASESGSIVNTGRICNNTAGSVTTPSNESTGTVIEPEINMAGFCGTWTYYTMESNGNNTYALTIFGVGETDNYTSSGKQPWYTPTSGNNAKVSTVKVESGVTKLGSYLFSYTGNASVIFDIADTVTAMGEYVFYYSDLTTFEFPANLTNWSSGGNTFTNAKNLTTVKLPEGITTIPQYMFYGCSSLKSIVIPDGVTSISKNAFLYCSNFENIFIPTSVTSIGDNAFYATNVTKQVYFNVYYAGTEVEWNAITTDSGNYMNVVQYNASPTSLP